jgi:acetyl esterase/lipase
VTHGDQLDAEIAEAVRAVPIPDLDETVLQEMRGFSFSVPELSDLVTRVEMEVPGDPPVPVRIHAPAERTGLLPGVVAIHGGGYVIGDRTMYDGLFDRWCLDPGVVGVSVGYRLAPENPYPDPLDDCYRALQWTVEHAEELGIDPSCIGVYGASAGGGLAAGLALLARDRGEVQLAFQFLQYPMLDDRQTTPSSQLEDLYIWSRSSNAFGWKAYLGVLYGRDDVPGYAAPARAEDLEGLPPAYVCVGALDGFRDEDIGYAQRLLHAGVPTELHVLPGAPHGFEMMGNSALARQSTLNADEWIRRQLKTNASETGRDGLQHSS